MSTVAFRKGAPNEWRIVQCGEHVGDIHRQRDILDRTASFFTIHLDEDPAASCACTIPHASARPSWSASHPLWP